MSFGSKERGYYAPTFTTGSLLLLSVIIGTVGWGVIEFILWVFSFIHISFGGSPE